MLPKTGSETVFEICLETISRHPGAIFRIRTAKGPASLRKALTASQGHVAKCLEHYAGHRYSRKTISTWERLERGYHFNRKYAMPERVRCAYQAMLADLVREAGRGAYELQARMGPRVWHFALIAHCRQCGRRFHLRRARDVRCPICQRRDRARH